MEIRWRLKEQPGDDELLSVLLLHSGTFLLFCSHTTTTFVEYLCTHILLSQSVIYTAYPQGVAGGVCCSVYLYVCVYVCMYI